MFNFYNNHLDRIFPRFGSRFEISDIFKQLIAIVSTDSTLIYLLMNEIKDISYGKGGGVCHNYVVLIFSIWSIISLLVDAVIDASTEQLLALSLLLIISSNTLMIHSVCRSYHLIPLSDNSMFIFIVFDPGQNCLLFYFVFVRTF